jgi:hypothetical protein
MIGGRPPLHIRLHSVAHNEEQVKWISSCGCYKGIWRNGGRTPLTFSSVIDCVSSWLQTPTVLCLGNGLSVFTEEDAAWTRQPVRTFRKNLPCTEPRFLGDLICGMVTVQTELTWLNVKHDSNLILFTVYKHYSCMCEYIYLHCSNYAIIQCYKHSHFTELNLNKWIWINSTSVTRTHYAYIHTCTHIQTCVCTQAQGLHSFQKTV